MNLDLDQQQAELANAFQRFFEKECPPGRVRASEPLGFDPDLWVMTRSQGAVTMAVGEADGGWGASLLDLCLVAEQHGRCLTPVPMVEAQVAARLLAGLGGDDASSRLKGMLAGGRLVTTAILPERDGKLLAVPGGAVADEVLFLGNDAVMTLELSDSNRRFTANIGCLPLADIETEGARPLGWGAPAMRAFDRAVDDWMILTAGAMVGLASRALEIGCDYARDRHQFGAPIGSFQGVAHPLADSAAAIDGARLLCYETAWSAGSDQVEEGWGPEMSLWFSGRAAADATRRSLHVHGGYGFMTEYDIQLYFRRAKGWPNVAGDPRAMLRRIADRRYGAVEQKE